MTHNPKYFFTKLIIENISEHLFFFLGFKLFWGVRVLYFFGVKVLCGLHRIVFVSTITKLCCYWILKCCFCAALVYRLQFFKKRINLRMNSRTLFKIINLRLKKYITKGLQNIWANKSKVHKKLIATQLLESANKFSMKYEKILIVNSDILNFIMGIWSKTRIFIP